MAYPFPSEEWIKAAMIEVNNSQAYKVAAKSWEGDLVFVVNAIPGQKGEMGLYMDLWHGECRDAYLISAPESQKSEFTIVAPYAVWRKVLEGKLDPIRGLVSRQLKMKGNMMKIMKAPATNCKMISYRN